MLIDFKLLLKVDAGSVSIQDRHNCVNAVISAGNDQQMLEFKSFVPNQLTFKITNFLQDFGAVELKSLTLGGLTLDNTILQQICVFYPKDSDQNMITTRWWKDGILSLIFLLEIGSSIIYCTKIK